MDKQACHGNLYVRPNQSGEVISKSQSVQSEGKSSLEKRNSVHESPEVGGLWHIEGMKNIKQQESCVNIYIAHNALIGEMLGTFSFALKAGSELQGSPGQCTMIRK